MDPLADKCLTTAAFIYMVTDHVCSPIVLAVILFREFAVAGVRMLAAETGTVIAANMWGKVKTVLQMLTIIFYYFVGADGRAHGCWLCQLCYHGALLALRRGDPALRRHLPVAEPQAFHAGEVNLSWPPLEGLRPQAVGERALPLPDMSRITAKFSPTGPAGPPPSQREARRKLRRPQLVKAQSPYIF